MPDTRDASVLEALLDSWDRNHAILVNLLRALPEEGMNATAVPGSPTVVQLFMHMHWGSVDGEGQVAKCRAFQWPC